MPGNHRVPGPYATHPPGSFVRAVLVLLISASGCVLPPSPSDLQISSSKKFCDIHKDHLKLEIFDIYSLSTLDPDRYYNYYFPRLRGTILDVHLGSSMSEWFSFEEFMHNKFAVRMTGTSSPSPQMMLPQWYGYMRGNANYPGNNYLHQFHDILPLMAMVESTAFLGRFFYSFSTVSAKRDPVMSSELGFKVISRTFCSLAFLKIFSGSSGFVAPYTGYGVVDVVTEFERSTPKRDIHGQHRLSHMKFQPYTHPHFRNPDNIGDWHAPGSRLSGVMRYPEKLSDLDATNWEEEAEDGVRNGSFVEMSPSRYLPYYTDVFGGGEGGRQKFEHYMPNFRVYHRYDADLGLYLMYMVYDIVDPVTRVAMGEDKKLLGLLDLPFHISSDGDAWDALNRMHGSSSKKDVNINLDLYFRLNPPRILSEGDLAEHALPIPRYIPLVSETLCYGTMRIDPNPISMEMHYPWVKT